MIEDTIALNGLVIISEKASTSVHGNEKRTG